MAWFGWTLLQILGVTVVILLSCAFLIWGDRKLFAAVGMRKGPNVVGPFGLLQSFADLGKFLIKEQIIPAGADKFVFLLAPLISVTLALGAWAAMPLAPGWVVSNINVGILFLFAVSSMGVYGVIMGGWASNSKYPFLGALRSAAQMISYEVSIGFISTLAETNRPPFDLPEAESELVAGYQVEYGSSPFMLFYLSEQANIVLMS